MTVKISHSESIKQFLNEASGVTNNAGNPRLKEVVNAILKHTVQIIENLEISPEEFWTAVNYLNVLGARGEAGLLVAGLGLEHYLDLLLDAKDQQVGIEGGTPRTIEGPLYVAGAPLTEHEARLDDGKDPGRVLFMQGQVLDITGQPLAGAVVDIWHANTKGSYSYFDGSQSEFNLRRRITTDSQGRYRFRSIVPSGYGCPPDGPTQQLLTGIGRHGQRPAHIHFFISAPRHRHLTTQINLAGDAYLHDDFAYATRDELIAEVRFVDDPQALATKGLSEGFAEINFDFALHPSHAEEDLERGPRVRALES